MRSDYTDFQIDRKPLMHSKISYLLRKLWFQVLVAMAAGILLGLLQPAVAQQMKPLADGFIALIKMIVAPIIFCTLVHGVAGMNDMKRAGRVAVKALIYFEVITLVALLLALLAVNLWQPGVTMNVDPTTIDTSALASYTHPAAHRSLIESLLGIIPTTFASAFTQPDLLQVLLVSLLFAFGLVLVGQQGRPIYDFIGALSQVFFKIVGLIMWLAPIAAFGAIAFTVGKFGAATLLSLGQLILCFYSVCAVFVILVLGSVARWVGVSLWRLLVFIKEEIFIVAATASSESAFPALMQKLRRLGCDESVVGLVVPTGYSFNLDGTCLYLATTAVFLAQATHTPLDVAHQLGLLLVLLVTSKGAAGVSGSALIVLAATLTTVGTVPVASLALVLGIHRIMSEAISFTNLVGNCIATIVVSKWERAVDQKLLSQVNLRSK
jgi:aerobic C4-dicarboxylate transport protein